MGERRNFSSNAKRSRRSDHSKSAELGFSEEVWDREAAATAKSLQMSTSIIQCLNNLPGQMRRQVILGLKQTRQIDFTGT